MKRGTLKSKRSLTLQWTVQIYSTTAMAAHVNRCPCATVYKFVPTWMLLTVAFRSQVHRYASDANVSFQATMCLISCKNHGSRAFNKIGNVNCCNVEVTDFNRKTYMQFQVRIWTLSSGNNDSDPVDLCVRILSVCWVWWISAEWIDLDCIAVVQQIATSMSLFTREFKPNDSETIYNLWLKNNSI